MKPIYIAAVEMANANQLKDSIVDVLKNMGDCEFIERFIETVFGVDVKVDKLATITEYDGWECTLIKFDYITDTVEYQREKDITRYFSDKDKAERYSNTGEYRYSDMKYDMTDEYCFPGVYHEVGTDATTKYFWDNRKVIVK